MKPQIVVSKCAGETIMALRPADRFIPWVFQVARLKCWGRPLTDVPVRLRYDAEGGGSGVCYVCPRRIAITACPDPARTISVIVHEFAHAAAVNVRGADTEHHDERFKERLQGAITELTGFDPGMLDNYRTLQRACDDAVRAWWGANHAAAWETALKFERLAKGGRP